MIYKTVAGVAAALALSGCAAIDTPLDEGYEFGDMTGSVLEVQAKYCAESDPYQRAVMIAAMRSAGVKIPASGACTDILELIPDPELDGVDVEQAERDKERFSGRNDSEAPEDDESAE